jgi:hypothetical protein
MFVLRLYTFLFPHPKNDCIEMLDPHLPLFVILGFRVYPRPAFIFIMSWLICVLFPEVEVALLGVCVSFISLVFGFFVWALLGDREAIPRDPTNPDLIVRRPSRVERRVTSPSENARQVDTTCVFHAAVDGRSRHSDVCQEQVEDPSHLPCLRSVEDVDAPVALSSEADASGLKPLESALALDVDERGSGADALVVEVREQVVSQVARLPEHSDPMVIDPWYWQGIVTYDMSEVPGVNDVIPMEVDVDEPVLDVVMAEPDGALATQVGAPLEEHNELEVREDDIVMAEPLLRGDGDVVMTEVEVPGEPMEVDIPNHVEAQEHLGRVVDPDVQMADAVGAEASSSGGDLPVMSESREEGANEAAVLNRGASDAAGSDLPAPRSEEGRRLIKKRTLVLNKAKAVLNNVDAVVKMSLYLYYCMYKSYT